MSLIDSFNTLFYAYNKMLNVSCKIEGYNEITVASYQYLVAVFDAKQITITKLAQILGVKKASVTQMIHSLMSKGYVKKAKDDSDRRSSIIELTDKGYKLMESEESVYQSFMNQICESLDTQDLKQLEHLLTKLAKGVQRLDAE
jgi:DNA-binding MarR family transcriptional regulator